MKIQQKYWGNIEEREVYLFEMENSNGLTVSVTNYGAIIASIITPNKFGDRKNIVLGYDSLKEYLSDPFFLGCVVGRVANRIKGGAFSINGQFYQLAINEPSNNCHLHGGYEGFSKKVFTIVDLSSDEHSVFVKMEYISPDMEEGYPGNVTFSITYTLFDTNDFLIDYHAVTDKPTHFNITNHSYFNLSGEAIDATQHSLCINAEQYVEIDAHYLPTGKLIDVMGTSNDFRKSRPINEHTTIGEVCSYNECFVLNSTNMDTCAAELYNEVSGRKMNIYTTLPGIMFYSGFDLCGRFRPCQGVCLETQFFPDAANRPEFQSTLLQPEEVYRHQTKLKFSTV
jgi:aldose 1-epimerase